jgi:ribosomal protein L37AE/L43A
MIFDKKIKFCPNCGSPNIEWELPQTWSVWKCLECGYIGAFIIEDGEIAVEIRKDYIKKHSKEGKKSDAEQPL